MNTSEFAVKALASAATAFVDALLAPIHERLAALEDADKASDMDRATVEQIVAAYISESRLSLRVKK